MNKNSIEIDNIKPNEVAVVLPDSTVVYGPVESVVATVKGLNLPCKVDIAIPNGPAVQTKVQPHCKEVTDPVFSHADRKILSYLKEKDLDKLEAFMYSFKHLLNWKEKTVPFLRGTTPGKKLPIRGDHRCYVDCYGNVFSSLKAVGMFYQVDIEDYARKAADKIRIPEFNDSKDAYIFWHLNFKDHRGISVSIIKDWRCDFYEWEPAGTFDEKTEYSRKLHQFARYAIDVEYARLHVNDTPRRPR